MGCEAAAAIASAPSLNHRDDSAGLRNAAERNGGAEKEGGMKEKTCFELVFSSDLFSKAIEVAVS